MIQAKTYTPEQIAQILQLSKNTVYDLIAKGEIIAKKFGKVYRIPEKSISFVFSGLDDDILNAQLIDDANLKKTSTLINKSRDDLWKKSKSL